MDDLINLIPTSGTIVLSHAVSTSSKFVKLLADNAEKFKHLEIIHMVPVVPPLYCEEEYKENFVHNALFAGLSTKNAIKDGRANYTPIYFSQVPDYLKTRKIDLFVTQVSREIDGNVSLGVSIDYGIAAIKSADKTIAFQNEKMPYTYGDGVISLSNIDYLIKTDEELCEIQVNKSTNHIYEKIASHIMPHVCDGATLQLGIGALPDAVLSSLDSKSDLGVHSEMVSNSIVELMMSGNITNKFKKNNVGKSIVSFAMGNRRLYDYLDLNDKFSFKSVNYVNDPFVIGENENVVSINSALQVDLHGQVNAEMIAGVQVSGVGGQVDFVRGAQISKFGKSIIAFPSTNSDGTISRVVKKIGEDGVVTTSRNDVDYICTEFGCVKLSGKSLSERKELLCSIAHPKFRDELRY